MASIQINSEYVEAIGSLLASGTTTTLKVSSEYLEVIAPLIASGTTTTAKVQSEYLEVIASLLTIGPPCTVAGTPGLLTVSWPGYGGSTGYQVWMGTTSGGEALFATLPASQTSLKIGGLAQGQVYYFYIVSNTSQGYTGAGPEALGVFLTGNAIVQLSPLLEDGGCIVAYYGTPNSRVAWSVNVGSLTPLSNFTDATGVACAYYTPGAAVDVDLVLEDETTLRVLEDGVTQRILEGGFITAGTVVNITVQQYT